MLSLLCETRLGALSIASISILQHTVRVLVVSFGIYVFRVGGCGVHDDMCIGSA